MKRNKIWYLGYGIAAILVIILFAADLSEPVKLGFFQSVIRKSYIIKC